MLSQASDKSPPIPQSVNCVDRLSDHLQNIHPPSCMFNVDPNLISESDAELVKDALSVSPDNVVGNLRNILESADVSHIILKRGISRKQNLGIRASTLGAKLRQKYFETFRVNEVDGKSIQELCIGNKAFIGVQQTSETKIAGAANPKQHDEEEFLLRENHYRRKSAKKKKVVERTMSDSEDILFSFTKISNEILRILNDPVNHDKSPFLSDSLLNEICSEILLLKSTNQFKEVNSDVIQTLLESLRNHVDYCGTELSKVNSKDILKHQNIIFSGLESCLVVLHAFSFNEGETLKYEDELFSVITFCKNICRQHLYPYLETRTSMLGGIKGGLMDSNSRVNAWVTKTTEALGLFEKLLKKIILTNSMIYILSSLCLPVFFLDGQYSLKMAALPIITEIFSNNPHQRITILDGIFNDLVKLPNNKRLAHTHKVSGANVSISMISLLFVRLLQCCTDLVGYESQDDKERDTYLSAVNCAKHYVESFFKTIEKGTNEKEYRFALVVLVEDMMKILLVPEYPASSLVLFIISQKLVDAVHSHIKKESNDPFYVLCIQLLGDIASDLKKKSLLFTKDNFFVIPKARTLNEQGECNEEEVTICSCGGTDSTPSGASIPMIDCDRCHRWFHIRCMGLSEKYLPSHWLCDQCLLAKQIKLMKGDAEISGVSESIMEPSKSEMSATENDMFDVKFAEQYFMDTSVLKQMLLNHLHMEVANDPMAIYAKKYYLSMWQHEDSNSGNNQYYHSQLNYNLNSEKERLPTLSPNGVSHVICQLEASRPLMSSFSTLLSTILRSLGSSQTKARSRAVKSLNSVIEADPTVLREEHVRTAVQARCWDTSTSVREAGVDLVGRFILFRLIRPKIVEDYFNIISERVLDKGTSVRKRVISIFLSVCLRFPSHVLVPKIILKLASRLKDTEQSVRKLVLKSFRALWFCDGEINISSSCMVPTNSKHHLVQPKDSFTTTVAQKVDQILSVVSYLLEHDLTLTWFSELMVDLVKEDTDKKEMSGSDPTSKRESGSMFHYIENMCLHLIKMPVNAFEGDISTSTESRSTNINVPKIPKKVVYMVTLSLFAPLNPTVFSNFLESLAIYLQSRENYDHHNLILTSAAKIVCLSFPFIPHPLHSFVDSLIKDLGSLLFHQNLSVAKQAIESLCTVVQRHKDRDETMDSILGRFVKILLDYKHKRVKPENEISTYKIARAMFVIGHIFKYYYFDGDEKITYNDFNEISKVRYGSRLEVGLWSIREFCENEDITVRVFAIRSLGALFAVYPAIPLRCEDVIRVSLSPESNDRVKNQMLATLDEYLTDEEELMKKANEEAQKSSNLKDFKSITFSDSGVSANIVQQVLPCVLDNLVNETAGIRDGAVKLIRHILKRSLVHPVQCVERLIALQADHYKIIREGSLRALMIISDRDPSLVISRLGKGLKAAFEFESRVYPLVKPVFEASMISPEDYSKSNSGKLPCESILSSLYRIFKKTKTSRHNFLHSLLRLIENFVDNEKFVNYLVRCLASLSFSEQEEVLYLIYHINRFISFTGSSVLATCKKLFQDDDLTQDGDVSAVRHAAPVIYMIKLKKFLKRIYSITGARCSTYHPKEEHKQMKIISKNSIYLYQLDQSFSFCGENKGRRGDGGKKRGKVVNKRGKGNSDKQVEGEIDGTQRWWEDRTIAERVYLQLKRMMKTDDYDAESPLHYVASQKSSITASSNNSNAKICRKRSRSVSNLSSTTSRTSRKRKRPSNTLSKTKEKAISTAKRKTKSRGNKRAKSDGGPLTTLSIVNEQFVVVKEGGDIKNRKRSQSSLFSELSSASPLSSAYSSSVSPNVRKSRRISLTGGDKRRYGGDKLV